MTSAYMDSSIVYQRSIVNKIGNGFGKGKGDTTCRIDRIHMVPLEVRSGSGNGRGRGRGMGRKCKSYIGVIPLEIIISRVHK